MPGKLKTFLATSKCRNVVPGTGVALFFCFSLSLAAPLQGPPEDVLAQIEAAVAGGKKNKAFLDQLDDTLRHPDSPIPVKERAAWALGRLEAKSHTSSLLEAAKSKSLLVRSAALGSLVHLNPKDAVPVFVDIAQNDPVLSLRQRATIALGLSSSDQAVPVLVKLSLDERSEIRGAAALAMAAHHSSKKNFKDALKEMTGDESPYVAERAALGLRMAGRKSQSVARGLDSEDFDVRLFTVIYLNAHGGEAQLTGLKNAANGEADEDLRDRMNRAISSIKKRVEGARAKKERERQEAAAKNK